MSGAVDSGSTRVNSPPWLIPTASGPDRLNSHCAPIRAERHHEGEPSREPQRDHGERELGHGIRNELFDRENPIHRRFGRDFASGGGELQPQDQPQGTRATQTRHLLSLLIRERIDFRCFGASFGGACR